MGQGKGCFSAIIRQGKRFDINEIDQYGGKNKRRFLRSTIGYF
jgi:hypothetical protein